MTHHVYSSPHGAAPKTASRDLSALSSPNGNKEYKTTGPKAHKAIKFTDRLVEVAYVGESCGTEIKRTIKERSKCRVFGPGNRPSFPGALTLS
jgi:hypothetical protein